MLKLMTIILFFLSIDSQACTSFVLQSSQGFSLGQNYDFALTHAGIFINQSGYIKTSLVNHPKNEFSWVSKYGSLTFSQFGQELPASGINEKGLIVQMLWNFDEPILQPKNENGAYLNELQWVQYQLDNFQTTDEVKANLHKIEIEKTIADLHYVICDKVQCLLIEYVDGKLTIFSEDEYYPRTITNNSYSKSKQLFEDIKNYSQYTMIKKRKTSESVYQRASWLLHNYNMSDAKDNADEKLKAMLSKVSFNYHWKDIIKFIFTKTPPSVTVWSAIFNPNELTVQVSAKEKKDKYSTIKLKGLFKKCSPSLALEFERGKSFSQKDITKLFSTDSKKVNRSIIKKAYENIPEVSEKVQEFLINYPSSMKCASNYK